MKCHAGCEFASIVAALRIEDGPSSDSRIVEAYDYADEAGTLLFQVVRFRDPKTFRQRCPDGSWGLGDTRRVLYRLPAIVESERAIWVVEGEKDVHALERLGFVATCAPGGAGKWREEYSDTLADKPHILIVPDCDKPGRNGARAVANALHARAIPCRVLELNGSRDDGYDVSDLLLELGEDGARARLEALARATPTWPTATRPRLHTMGWDEFVAYAPPESDDLDYVGALVRGGERLHVIGPIGHGKSYFMLELAGAAAGGRDFLGFAGRGVRVVYVDLEMPPAKLGLAVESARLEPLMRSGMLRLVHQPEGLAIDESEQHRAMIEGLFEDFDVVMLDPWYKLIGDEIAEGMRNVRGVISFLDGLRKRFPEAACVLGFHANEPRKGVRLSGVGDASGYKAYQRPADTALIIERERRGRNRSRLIWAKSRSARLPGLGEEWLVEWKRREGFRRAEKRRASDEVHDALTRLGPATVYELLDELGGSRNRMSELLGELLATGRASKTGEKGRVATWAAIDPGQKELAL